MLLGVIYNVQGNRLFAAEGRYAEFYHEPATSLLRFDSFIF